jgi:hypothetical protein
MVGAVVVGLALVHLTAILRNATASIQAPAHITLKIAMIGKNAKNMPTLAGQPLRVLAYLAICHT